MNFKRIWERLSRREKGLVTGSMIILALVLARYLVFVPFLGYRERVKEELEIRPQILEKDLRYVNRKGDIEAGLDKARTELKGLEAVLLSGDTASVSASSLQEVVQALAAREGTQVITTRVLNPEVLGSFTKISVQLEVSSQIDQLANFFKGIGSADKLLTVSEVNVRSLFTPAAARPAFPGQPQGVIQQPIQSLRASLIVAGFARTQPTDAQGLGSAAPAGSVPKGAKATSKGQSKP